MHPKIAGLADGLKGTLVALRRDLHRYLEPGWTEFRTASLVVKKLQELGYDVHYGDEVIKEEAMMGVPAPEELDQWQEQALKQGADPEIVARMEGGKTGIVAILNTERPGPTLGFRFDMDANDVDEARDLHHRPFAQGFASQNPGAMHACGHDAHTAIGLGLTEVLMGIKDELKGGLSLCFSRPKRGYAGPGPWPKPAWSTMWTICWAST